MGDIEITITIFWMSWSWMDISPLYTHVFHPPRWFKEIKKHNLNWSDLWPWEERENEITLAPSQLKFLKLFFNVDFFSTWTFLSAFFCRSSAWLDREINWGCNFSMGRKAAIWADRRCKKFTFFPGSLVSWLNRLFDRCLEFTASNDHPLGRSLLHIRFMVGYWGGLSLV